MVKFLKKVWHDPVGSKLITALILSIVGYVVKNLIDKSSLFSGYLNEQVEVSRWIIYLITILSIILIYRWLNNKTVKYINNKKHTIKVEDIAPPHEDIEIIPEDIIARLMSWWARAAADSTDYINVNFKSLENELKLPKGSVKKYIERVAHLKCYKVVSIGNTDAHFEWDYERGINGGAFNQPDPDW